MARRGAVRGLATLEAERLATGAQRLAVAVVEHLDGALAARHAGTPAHIRVVLDVAVHDGVLVLVERFCQAFCFGEQLDHLSRHSAPGM